MRHFESTLRVLPLLGVLLLAACDTPLTVHVRGRPVVSQPMSS